MSGGDRSTSDFYNFVDCHLCGTCVAFEFTISPRWPCNTIKRVLTDDMTAC